MPKRMIVLVAGGSGILGMHVVQQFGVLQELPWACADCLSVTSVQFQGIEMGERGALSRVLFQEGLERLRWIVMELIALGD
jgi:hypothetical protein